jgi:hypothetical protein
MAKFEIPLNADTIVEFFQFPNYFFNILIFRDERSINTTVIRDTSIIINGTNSTLIERFKNDPIQVTVNVENVIDVKF